MVNVVYACNDAYAKQTLVSMVSLVKHNPDSQLYLVEDHMSAENISSIQSTLQRWGKTVIMLPLEDVLPDLKLDDKDRHPKTIYAKLFLAEHIQGERILYLDSDVIVSGSLEPLFERSMETEPAAGVMMPYSVKQKNRVFAYRGEPYVCDGIVLFNLKLWRSENLSNACIRYIEQQNGLPPMLSEGTLNHVCHGRLGTLEPKYNLMPAMLMYSLKEIRKLFRADCYYTDEKAMEEAREHPVIIHFMNELYNRPWYEPCDHPYGNAYRDIYLELYGRQDWIQQPLGRHTRMTRWLREKLPFEVYAALYRVKNNKYL